MTPAQYCKKKTIAANSSFFLPFLFLTPQRRSAMYALYAFCREVDDIVDGGLPKQEARSRLEGWRQTLHQAFSGTADHPVGVEVGRYQQVFDLPTQPFYDILDGMEMDLLQNRYQTLEELAVYCHKVAVAVGLLAVRIFVHDDSEESVEISVCETFAQHLGMAFQLTNILRDVAEDGRMGRIYLPQQLLQAAAVSEADVLHGRWTPSLAKVMRQLGDVAKQHYQDADTLIGSARERRRLRPAFLMAGIYQTYLERLRCRDFDCFGVFPGFSLAAKIGILWRVWWRESGCVPGQQRGY